jgi:hypothetical protein
MTIASRSVVPSFSSPSQTHKKEFRRKSLQNDSEDQSHHSQEGSLFTVQEHTVCIVKPGLRFQTLILMFVSHEVNVKPKMQNLIHSENGKELLE